MATKIQKISITNFKAISEFEADFKGCTAIITAGNNKGKTTLLCGIPDRIRSIKPDMVVKNGTSKGKGEMVLTSGERFVWEFDASGYDKLVFHTKEGYKTNVTKEISAKFFPALFDIDKFLQSGPKDQAKQLQKIIGIDFTDIDSRYKIAYDNRTEKNRDSERYHAKLVEMLEVPKVEAVDLTELTAKKEQVRKELNNLYLANKAKNDSARNTWNNECNNIREADRKANEIDMQRRQNYAEAKKALAIIQGCGYTGKEVDKFLNSIADSITGDLVSIIPSEPTYITEMPDDQALKVIDDQILKASEINQKASEYLNYIRYKKQVEEAKEAAFNADVLVKGIEAERNTLIEKTNFPAGIAITPDGITVDGFPLDKNQISTSKLYCAALRIASMNLGEVKTLYFDASFLDRSSLSEIEVWANENDLQLLIERPDFDGGEIKYEIIEQTNITADVAA